MEVHILLTRTSTMFSRAIHALTGDEYTHAAIGVDGIDGVFYGFGRKYPRLPFPGAFRKECPWMFHHDTPCRIYSLEVNDICYDWIRSVLDMMYEHRDCYHYNIAGLLSCRFNMNLPSKRPYHFFCSQFVAWLLQETGSIDLPVAPEVFRPSYFCALEDLNLVYEGTPIHPSDTNAGNKRGSSLHCVL